MFRKFLYIFLGIVIALEIFLSPSQAQAQTPGNQIPGSACEFQPPASDRSPTVNNIRQLGHTGSNISWDNTYIGLHRWNADQWPGVDYLVPTTLPFKNGGTVRLAGWDSAGGGNSLFIDGEGACEGWYVFIGHLNYSPGARFSKGQHIGPDEIIGEPGCSGFENNCADKGSKIPPHNHYTLGYTQNIFGFADGTDPAFVKGHYWIHPARVEGSAVTLPPATQVSATEAPTPELTIDFGGESFTDNTNGPVLETPKEWIFPSVPFRVPLWAYPVLIFSVCVFIFARGYRPLGFAGAVITVLFLFTFYYIPQKSTVQASQTVFILVEDFDLEAVPTSAAIAQPTAQPTDQPTNSDSDISIASLDDEQNKTLSAIILIGQARGVPERYVLAAITTGLVEDSLHNSTVERDADSQNWRQERRRFYADKWEQTGGSLNLSGSVNRFYDECYKHDTNQSADKLAGDVQRPKVQYRNRYQQRMAEAERLYYEWITKKNSK